MRLLLIALLLNCQVQSNPTLVDEFVHSEIQSRKRVIEQAFALWQVRWQVEITDKQEGNQHRIVFTDTCQEDFVKIWKLSCAVTISGALGSCTYLVNESVIIIRRSYYQNVTDDIKVGLVAHEIGHCMGMQHSDNPQDMMYPSGNLVPTEAEIIKIHTMRPEGQLFKYALYDQY